MIYPDFYEKFECKADMCFHTCCRGWEIDIDDDTAEFYRSLEGKIGDKLRITANLDPEDGSQPHFILKDDKCPFLLESGLCEMILEEGEDILCDICSLHPRFFGQYQNIDYAGVGLSCEKSCELLLETDEPITFVGDEVKEFNRVFSTASLTYTPEFSEVDVEELIEILSETEPIDENWTLHIEELQGKIGEITDKINNYTYEYNAKLYNRIYSYILYRQLERCEEYSWETLCDYAAICTDFVFMEDALTRDTKEALRRFSEQIEYCPENVSFLMEL
ncbi:MAG: flagellin lysine-N-methylase [Lachnospiraceae bacterium]|nr:flagellin lysine-N-methylase [Lachnospiraceae bacterium]